MTPPSSYGQMWAMRRAKQLQQRRDEKAAKPKAKRQARSKPSLELDPMRLYKPEGRQRSISWSDERTDSVSSEVASRLANGPSKMALLSMPTGTGKTAAAVEALGKLQARSGKPLKFVVSAPRAVVEQGGWHETLAWWNESFPSNVLRPWCITTPDKLAAQIADKSGLIELVQALGDNGVIVIDECHGFKNPTSKRSKMMQKVRHLRKLGLTATPLTNDPVMDGASYLILGGYYTSKSNFMSENKIDRMVGQFGELLIYDSRGRVIEGMWPLYSKFKSDLADVIYKPSVSMADVDMPEVTLHIEQLPHDDGLDADMRSLAKAWRMRMLDSAADLMLASFERLTEDRQRLEKLYEVISQDVVRQPLIFYWHVHAGDAVEAFLKEKGVNGVQRVDGGTDVGSIDLTSPAPILMQYQAGSEGIEFKGSNTTIFYEPQGSWSKLQQAKGRNVRRGMSGSVDHWLIISDCAIDREVNERLRMHDEVNDEMLQAIVAEALGVSLG